MNVSVTAKEMAKAYAAKEYTAQEAMKRLRDKVEKEDVDINAFLEMYSDIESQAENADKMREQQGESVHPLCGIPVALKDNVLVHGHRASAGSRMLEEYVATYDATVVQRLKEVGAIIFGRTNMDEFAMGSSTEFSAFGPTKNPHDLERSPGGTSGGAAAAVAAEFVPISLGVETCGSTRQPASLCGISALKPTYGSVSRSGVMAMGSSLDQVSPMARSVADLEVVFDTIRGFDPLDSNTYPENRDEKVEGKRIGVPREFLKEGEKDVLAVFEENLQSLAKKGYEIVDIALKESPKALAAYHIVMAAEVSTNLSRFDGMRYGLNEGANDLLGDYKSSRAKGFGAESRRRILLGTYVLSAGYYDSYYKKATALRDILNDELNEAYKDVSYIATPAAPNAAFKFGEKADPVAMYLQDIFHAPANLTGTPAVVVPGKQVMVEGKELPVGIQFMGPRYSEYSLFRTAKEFLGEQ